MPIAVEGCCERPSYNRVFARQKGASRDRLVYAIGVSKSRIEILSIVKGSGRGGQHQQHRPTLSEGGDFAVHTSVYGKVQVEPSVKPNDQQREKAEKEACWLPKVGWLATYVGYVPCLSTCLYWGGGIHPTTIDSTYVKTVAR